MHVFCILYGSSGSEKVVTVTTFSKYYGVCVCFFLLPGSSGWISFFLLSVC